MIYSDTLPETTVYEEDYETAEWHQVLAPLDEKYRIILLLYYMEDFSTKEISDILDLKISTVKTRLQRGRRILAQEYQYHIKEEHA